MAKPKMMKGSGSHTCFAIISQFVGCVYLVGCRIDLQGVEQALASPAPPCIRFPQSSKSKRPSENSITIRCMK